MGERELARICARLRNHSEPIISHETWGGSLLGVSVGLLIGFVTLTGSGQTAFLRGALLAGAVASFVGFAILVIVGVAVRQRRGSESHLIADELEDIASERLRAQP